MAPDIFAMSWTSTVVDPGDLPFVPAGVEHRFEDFTDDLAAGVVCYGQDGGERAGEER